MHISDKVVGLLLRARKHKLLDFEGEILFQRRDDDVPIMMLKTMKEIRDILKQKEEDVRRSVSPNPLATTLLIKWNALDGNSYVITVNVIDWGWLNTVKMGLGKLFLGVSVAKRHVLRVKLAVYWIYWKGG